MSDFEAGGGRAHTGQNDAEPGPEPHPGQIDAERLLAFARGDMTGFEAEEIREHARSCSECGDELAVLLALRLEVGAAEESPGAPAAVAVGKRGVWALIAASVVFVAVLGGLMMSGVLAPQPPEVARLATTMAPDRVDLDFLFGGQSAAASTGETARGGFTLIVERRFAEAVSLLSALNEAQPADDEVATGLGIALYLSGDSGGRVQLLLNQGAATGRQDLNHYAKWYLGNLYLRRGDLARAVTVLEDVSNEPDFPGTRARDLLQRLRAENQ